jgi:hypothetical protein
VQIVHHFGIKISSDGERQEFARLGIDKGLKAEHLFDFAHGGSFGYFGAAGPFGVGLGLFGKGTVDVSNAYDQFNRDAAACGGPMVVDP